MTTLAYVNELRWRWIPKEYKPLRDGTPVIGHVKELGYWCDGEWHAVPTEEHPTDE